MPAALSPCSTGILPVANGRDPDPGTGRGGRATGRLWLSKPKQTHEV